MRRKAAVVGNGPAGCYAAMHAAQAGEVAIIGPSKRRVQCAGLISLNGLSKLGVRPGGYVLNKVRGAKLISPDGSETLVDGGRTMAYAVDRLAFDNHLLNMAVAQGAEYIDDRVTSLKAGAALASGGRVEADRIILATGSDYTLQAREDIPRPRECLVGGQYELDVECAPDFVELHFIVPEFFAWVIPVGDRARVGLCAKGNPRPSLDAFVRKLKLAGRLKSDRRHSETFGVIPVHDPGLRTVHGNIALVGDAAGHVKATTGGGIVLGALAARHATAPDYDLLWRREIGRDLRLHLMIHRMLARLSDRGKNRFLRIVNSSAGTLRDGGDMDDAWKTTRSMLGNPRFTAELAMNLPWLLADIMCPGSASAAMVGNTSGNWKRKAT